MAPTVEMPVELSAHGGFPKMLLEVLTMLGVPTERIECFCRGEAGPAGGFQGHLVIHLRVPASETVPELRAFDDLDVEMSVEACIQSVCRTALRHVCRDAYPYLRGGPYHLLPRAVDPALGSRRLAVVADCAAFTEGNPCLDVMSRYVLSQDRYIGEIESQNRSYRSLLLETEERVREKERVAQELYEEAIRERTSFRTSTHLHSELERQLRGEIKRLEGELLERDLRLDHCNGRKLELKDALERCRMDSERRDFQESKLIHRVEAQAAKVADLQGKIKELLSKGALNLRHLKQAFKSVAYQKDKVQRTMTAWKKADARRVKEFRELQRTLPPGAHTEPRRETFEIGVTGLDTAACPSQDYPTVEKTAEFHEAMEYVRRMYRRGAPTAAGPSTATRQD